MSSCMNNQRSFPGYGLLYGIDPDSYMLDLIYWVYEDDIDGYLIVRNEMTGELRYVERMNCNVSYFQADGHSEPGLCN